MHDRVGRRIEEVTAQYAGETILVVAHGGTVGSSFVQLAGVSRADAITLTRDTMNTSITEWQQTGADERWDLVRCSDAAHLGLLASPTAPSHGGGGAGA